MLPHETVKAKLPQPANALQIGEVLEGLDVAPCTMIVKTYGHSKEEGPPGFYVICTTHNVRVANYC